MRIVVDIPDAYHELIKELEGYEPRQRAGRLRMLATMGLLTLNGGVAVLGGPQGAVAETSPANKNEDGGEAEQRKARSDMGLRMMGSLVG